MDIFDEKHFATRFYLESAWIFFPQRFRLIYYLHALQQQINFQTVVPDPFCVEKFRENRRYHRLPRVFHRQSLLDFERTFQTGTLIPELIEGFLANFDGVRSGDGAPKCPQSETIVDHKLVDAAEDSRTAEIFLEQPGAARTYVYQ